MKRVLIAGGNGFLGKHLSEMLLSSGYDVSILSRGASREGRVPVFHWNPYNNELDNHIIENTDYIINLAGENISGKRWSSTRKQEIIDSRVISTNFLYKKVSEINPKLSGFISASATGYYGAVTSEKFFNETDLPGNDFLSEVCVKWEEAAGQFKKSGIRTVSLRLGVVLSNNGGALTKMSLPVKAGLGSSPGNGKQYINWIDIDDLCRLFIYAIENKSISGVYNAVAPEQIQAKHFYQILAKVLNKPLILPNIPKIVMRTVFGQMSVILLEGSRISNEKIISAGFCFNYPTLESSLKKIYNK